ncbi:MAG: TIGR04211 family SH3 domain-containing protein, partial [Thermodesulfobacteriota bacterium]
MKWLSAAIGIFFLLVASPSNAQNTMYVNDVIKITMRTGPGIDHKVIAMLQSGETVQMLEQNPDWSKVRLPDGKEGWALTRFLTSKKPNEVQLRQIEEAYEELDQKADSLIQENAELHEENQRLLSRSEATR